MKILICFFALCLAPLGLQGAVPNEGKGLAVVSYAPVVEKAAPAVVNIYTEKVVERVDALFPGFFGEFLGSAQTTKALQKSLGSGVIVRPEGIIITNAHVVKGASKIRVILKNEEEYEADVLVEDSRLDLAALKLKASKSQDFPYLKIAPYDELRVGDAVLAIGCPRGLRHTVTGGLISGLGRTEVKKDDYRHLVQVDSDLAGGSSGGAIVIITAEGPMLAAISTAILTDHQGAPTGFGIPGVFIHPILRAVDNGGKVEPMFDGLEVQNITKEIAKALKIDDKDGVLVREVYENSPAAKADIQRGDILISLDDHPIRTASAHQFRLSVSEPNHEYKYMIRRNHTTLTKTLKVEVLSSKETKPLLIDGEGFLEGMVVQELSPALNYALGRPLMDKGVVIVELEKGSRSYLTGFRAYDQILKLNSKTITNLKDLQDALKSSIASLEIRRGDQHIRLMVG